MFNKTVQYLYLIIIWDGLIEQQGTAQTYHATDSRAVKYCIPYTSTPVVVGSPNHRSGDSPAMIKFPNSITTTQFLIGDFGGIIEWIARGF